MTTLIMDVLKILHTYQSEYDNYYVPQNQIANMVKKI